MFALPKEEDHFVPVKEAKNYNGIDLMKFLCAIMVFMIHITPFQGEVSEIAKCLNYGLQRIVCRVAVPFYFVSSGFFLFQKMPLYKPDPEIIKTYCFKLLRLLGTWHVLLVVGGTGHLWYLGATVVAVVLLSLCLHFRIKFGYICTIACVLYGIGLLGDAYYGIAAPLENIPFFNLLFKAYAFVFSITRNGVFMGFIFVLMGAAFANCRITLKPRTALTGFAVSMLCLVAEGYLLKHHDIPDDYNMYIFLLPAAFFLFSFASSVQLKDGAVYKHLRNMGVVIYFTHKLVDAFTSLAVRIVEKYCGIGLVPYQFALVLIFTLLLAVFTDWLSHKANFKWINWFLS